MYRSFRILTFAVAAVLGAVFVGSAATTHSYPFGSQAGKKLVDSWDDDVNGLTGAGLPPGSGTVSSGQQVYEQRCAVCHGDFGEGAGRYPVLAGGQGTLRSGRPVKTVGSYWPYAPTLFDYVRRAMPFNAPGTLTDDQVYGIVAYILNLNNIVPSNAVMNAHTLAAVQMPNRNGFINEHLKPDVHAVACMHDCKPKNIVILSDLAKTLSITPDETTTDPSGGLEKGAGYDSPFGPSGTPHASSTAAPATSVPAQSSAAKPVSFPQVKSILSQRCSVCHSAHPTEAGFTSAPLGIAFDTPAEIHRYAARIASQAVDSDSMPLGNITHMTAAERKLLGDWIRQGAKIP
jgi:mono/diheme cytochrome c family protein